MQLFRNGCGGMADIFLKSHTALFWLSLSQLKIVTISLAPRSGSPKCLRFGHWLTLCTLNIYLLTYFIVVKNGWRCQIYSLSVKIMITTLDQRPSPSLPLLARKCLSGALGTLVFWH